MRHRTKTVRLLAAALAAVLAFPPGALAGRESNQGGRFPVIKPAAGLAGQTPNAGNPGKAIAPALGTDPSIAVPVPAVTETGAVGLPGETPEAQEARGKLLERLSPDKAAETSAEQSSEDARRLIEGGGPQEASSSVDLTGAGSLAGGSGLGRGDGSSAGASSGRNVPAPRRGGRGLRAWLSDQNHYWRLYRQNLAFYVIENIHKKWATYEKDRAKALAAGVVLPVDSPRSFFSYLRVMGQTGRFYVLGFAAVENRAVVLEAYETFDRYFTKGVTPEARAAFRDFVGRAWANNHPKKSHSHFRKVVRDAMLTASLKDASQLASYFNGLVTADQTLKDFKFEARHEKGILDAMRAAVDETLAEETPGSGSVVGAILIGSFANGTANSHSDLDLEILTEGGIDGKLVPFSERLTARWKASGHHAYNPVSYHFFPIPSSRPLVDRIHDVEYLVFSRSPAVMEALARKPGEGATWKIDRRLTWYGRLLRWAQNAIVYWNTFRIFPRPAQ